MKSNRTTTRLGFSLLELIVSTAMLAALTTSCMVIVRTSYTVWHRHEDDHSQRQAGLDVLRHIVRQTRQIKAVTAISSASDISGSLTLLDQSGNQLVWEHSTASKAVTYGLTTATNQLASGIEELNFVGFKVDGTTPTTEAGLIHSVQCTTKVNLTRPSGTEAVINSCRVWIRSW